MDQWPTLGTDATTTPRSDSHGRTRWLDIALDSGGEARVASFRAFLDAPRHVIALSLSEDLLVSRADATTGQTI